MPEYFYLALFAVSYAALFVAAMCGAETMLILISMITVVGNIVVGKVITLFGFQISPSGGLAVILFWIGSLLTQYYGLRPARRALWYNFASLTFLTLVGWLTMKLPGGNTPEMDQATETLFTFMPGCMFGALMSFGVSYLFTIYVQRKVQKKHDNCIHWSVQSAIVAIANLLDITIFCTIAFWTAHVPLFPLILMTWGTRLVALVAGLPVILLIRRLYKIGKFPLLHREMVIGCTPASDNK